MVRRNKKIYSYELIPILECLIPDKGIIYGETKFGLMYWTYIDEGGNPDDF
jgi:hypothetical protein